MEDIKLKAMPLTQFGFLGFGEFITSLLKPKFMLKAWYLWIGLAPLFALVEHWLGISGPLLIAFFALNLIELLTGIRASVYEGKTLESNKLQRFFIKFFVYISIIAATHQYKVFTVLNSDNHGWASDFFGWAHSGLLSGLSIILIRSIFENLWRMGIKEAGIIYGILDNKWTRFVAIIFAPPDKEKAER